MHDRPVASHAPTRSPLRLLPLARVPGTIQCAILQHSRPSSPQPQHVLRAARSMKTRTSHAPEQDETPTPEVRRSIPSPPRTSATVPVAGDWFLPKRARSHQKTPDHSASPTQEVTERHPLPISRSSRTLEPARGLELVVRIDTVAATSQLAGVPSAERTHSVVHRPPASLAAVACVRHLPRPRVRGPAYRFPLPLKLHDSREHPRWSRHSRSESPRFQDAASGGTARPRILLPMPGK